MAMARSGFWIFVSNPRTYPIDAHMREWLPNHEGISSWTVEKNAQFEPGDLGLVRVGVDQRNRAALKRDGAPQRLQSGIYAACQVLGEPPYTLERKDDERWGQDDPSNSRKTAPSIPIKYLWWTTENPLLITNLRDDFPNFNAHVLNGLQKKYFPIQETDFRVMVNLLPVEARQAIDKATNIPSLDPEDADTVYFDPENIGDARNRVLRTIRERRGQQRFRDDLLSIYGRRCAITDCDIVDVLEAAHVTPYLGTATNHVTNGLLLRADLHTLLDCGLLSVDPETRRVILAPAIQTSGDYKDLHGRRLREPIPSSAAPSTKALEKARLTNRCWSDSSFPARPPIAISI
jgi:hypothetical protein